MFPAAAVLPHITGGEPCGIVDPGQKEQLAQVIKGHADSHMLLGILPKLRHNQASGVFLTRAAAGGEQYTPGISGCVKLSCAGQTFPVFTGLAEFTLVDWCQKEWWYTSFQGMSGQYSIASVLVLRHCRA